MFQRYNLQARRAIFFARYEASQHDKAEIDTPCLLLGILRDNRDLLSRLLPSPSAEPSEMAPADTEELARLSADVASFLPKTVKKVATHIDLPVTQAAIRALGYAAEESERLGHSYIAPEHLLVGLIEENGPEAACLKARGIGLERVRSAFPHLMTAGAIELDWARGHMDLIRALRSLPADRLEAAAALVEALASGPFEATGTSRKGPFHFSFEDEPA